MGEEAAAVVAVGHGIVVCELAVSSAAHCYDNGVVISACSGDDGNRFDLIEFDSGSSADCCCSPKSWVEIDSAFSAADDASSMDYQI